MIQPTDSGSNQPKKQKLQVEKPKPNWAEIEALFLAKVSVREICKLHPNVKPRQVTGHCAGKKLSVARDAISGVVRKRVEDAVLSVATEVGQHISSATRNLAKDVSRRSRQAKKLDLDEVKTLVDALKTLTNVRSDANPRDPSQDQSTESKFVQINIGGPRPKRSEPRLIKGGAGQVIDV